MSDWLNSAWQTAEPLLLSLRAWLLEAPPLILLAAALVPILLGTLARDPVAMALAVVLVGNALALLFSLPRANDLILLSLYALALLSSLAAIFYRRRMRRLADEVGALRSRLDEIEDREHRRLLTKVKGAHAPHETE